MASQIFLSTAYLLPRCILWIALFAGALVDGLRHVHVKSRGRQLYAGVILVLFAMVVQVPSTPRFAIQELASPVITIISCVWISSQDVLLLTYSATDSGTVFSVYIFFTDTADSLFTVRSPITPFPTLSH